MKRLRIGIDLDGVLADFDGKYIAMAKKLYPQFKPDLTRWDFGLTKEETDPIWKEIGETENFWQKLYPYKGAEDLSRLQHIHTLVFITNRTSTAGDSIERQSAAWLWKHHSITYPTVIGANHWYNKPEIYEALRLDSFIDDKAETVELMQKKHLNCYVYNQPWNEKVEAPRAATVNGYIRDVEDKLGD